MSWRAGRTRGPSRPRPTSAWGQSLGIEAPGGSILGRGLFQALHDLGDLDLGLADLAAAEVEEHGGAAQLLGQAVDVDLLPLDALEDAFELVHRRAEAQGLAGLRRSLSRLTHSFPPLGS